MGGSQGKAAEPTRVLPAGPEVSPTFPRRTRASISNDAPYPPAGGRITRLAKYYVFFSLGSVKPSRPAMGFARFFFRFFFRAGLRRALSSESDDEPADEPADGAAEWRGAARILRFAGGAAGAAGGAPAHDLFQMAKLPVAALQRAHNSIYSGCMAVNIGLTRTEP